MGGTWQTTGDGGGSGLGMAVLVVLGAALAVKVIPAVLAGVSEVVYVLLIVVAALVGAGMATLLGISAWRWRHRRPAAARATLPQFPGAVFPSRQLARAARPLPPPRPAIGHPTEVHLHLHGVSAEDVAAIIERQTPGPEVNRPGAPGVP